MSRDDHFGTTRCGTDRHVSGLPSRARTWLLFGAMWLLLLASAARAGEAYYALNTSSEDGAFVVPLPDVRNGEGRVARVKGKQAVPLVRLGEAWAAILELPRMQAVAFEVEDGEADPPLEVAEEGEGFRIEAGPAVYRFSPGGLASIATASAEVPFHTLKDTEAATTILGRGPGYVTLETRDTKGALAVVWTVLYTGDLRIEAPAGRAVEIASPAEGMQAWRFGPIGHDEFSYRVTVMPAGMDEPMQHVGRVNASDMKAKLEWIALLSEKTGPGFVMRRLQGGARYEPHGTIRPLQLHIQKMAQNARNWNMTKELDEEAKEEKAPLTAEQHALAHIRRLEREGKLTLRKREEAALTLNPPPRRRRRGKKKKKAKTPEGPAVVWLHPVASLTAAKEWGYRQDAVLVLRGADDGFEGTYRDHTVRILDESGDGLPGLDADRWAFLKDGKAVAGLKAIPFAEDPREEGNAIVLFGDIDGDGELSEREWSRPVYRFCDWNKDGVYLRGSILAGGRLEQDSFYERKEGSPDGKLWDVQLFALDQDGDNDQDTSVRRGMYNYTESGLGPFYKPEDFRGVRFDFGDADFAYVLLPSLTRGSVYTSCIDYDQGFFFSENASHDPSRQTAPETGVEAGFWRLTEEHQEYEHFETKTAAGHMWTYMGKLMRVIFGGINGGNWKLGIRFDKWEIWRTSEARFITYADPWGHEFRFVSMLKPVEWDGSKLEVRPMKDGHHDYVDITPWIWAVNQTAAALAIINPPASWGINTVEAYVQPTDPTSRIEHSENGKTTFFWYYSPLVRGLHHRGASEGKDNRNRLRYWDEDGDGVMDHYIYDPEGEGIFSRWLKYDREANRLWLTEGDTTLTWTDPTLTFPGKKMYLENFAEIELLYAMGENKRPMVEDASIGDDGALAGIETPTRPEKVEGGDHVLPVLVPAGLTGRESVNDKEEYGLYAMQPIFARNGFVLEWGADPLSAEALGEARLLLLSGLVRPPSAEETAAIKAWVEAGGVLYIEPSPPEEAQRDAVNRLLTDLGASLRLREDEVVNQDYGVYVRPYANYLGKLNGIMRKYMAGPSHRAVHYASPVGILDSVQYAAFEAYPITLPAQASPLLAYKSTMLAARESMGKGTVVVAGGPLLTHQFFWHKIHSFDHSSNAQLANNLVQWLREQIVKGDSE